MVDYRHVPAENIKFYAEASDPDWDTTVIPVVRTPPPRPAGVTVQYQQPTVVASSNDYVDSTVAAMGTSTNILNIILFLVAFVILIIIIVATIAAYQSQVVANQHSADKKLNQILANQQQEMANIQQILQILSPQRAVVAASQCKPSPIASIPKVPSNALSANNNSQQPVAVAVTNNTAAAPVPPSSKRQRSALLPKPVAVMQATSASKKKSHLRSRLKLRPALQNFAPRPTSASAGDGAVVTRPFVRPLLGY